MLVAYTVALDLIRALRPVVAELRKYSADAADQVERAASSIVLNIAEGDRRSGRDPQRFFAMANGSAGEIVGALDLADAWGWKIDSEPARALLDREQRLLWGLTRRGRSKSTHADRLMGDLKRQSRDRAEEQPAAKRAEIPSGHG